MKKIDGTGVTPRKSSGEAFYYNPEEVSFQSQSDKEANEEKERFEEAVEKAETQLEEEAEKTSEEASEEEGDIFRAQIQFLNDPNIKSNVEDQIEKGLTAEKAIEKGFEEPIQKLESQEGRIGERADDLRDIRDRLIGILAGEEENPLAEIPENTVIVAENLKPSDTSEMDRSKVKGIVTEKGSKTSHVAILSKSMRIPAVVGTGSTEGIEDGETILVDGKTGEIILEPSEEQLESIPDNHEEDVISKAVTTEDGKEVEIAANVANPEEVEKAVESGADGIGLYRTEFMFLERKEPPTEEEHYENYIQALNNFPDNRVIVRTMDIGGDKPVPYLDLDESDNPFLGKRGIRLAFDEGEELFEDQMRALLRAAASENGDNLAVMFPMIASLEEFEKALNKVDEIKKELEDEDVDYSEPELGLMIETPSAVQIAGELAEKADFLSIGTNDLTQYTMAASRTDGAVSNLQKPLYPAVLRSIKETIDKGHENDTWVGMCGEMAGNPRLTDLLASLGLDEFSMSAPVVPRIKSEVQKVSIQDSDKKADKLVTQGRLKDVEENL
jgi:phosphotransferase system enzyme I (PtsI)